MAGMLPGVECARRRRFHQSGAGCLDSLNSSSSSSHGSSTRRSSFCLYTSNNESHFSTMSSVQQRSPQVQAYCDEKLGVAAREAKERLDGRLRAQWKSEPKRNSGGQEQQQVTNLEYINEMMARESEMEVSGKKKKRTKSFSWGKLTWKSSEQDECSVCLEQLKEKETLIMQLPCAHSFHSKCLLPWLRDNSHCPCCRMQL